MDESKTGGRAGEVEPPRKLGEDALGDWLKLGLDELRQAFVPQPQQDFMGRPLAPERGRDGR